MVWTRVRTQVDSESRSNLVIATPGSVRIFLTGKYMQEDFTFPYCLCIPSCLQSIAVRVKYLNLIPNQMTAKTSDWPLFSKRSHSLGRGFGQESKKHELEDLSGGVGLHCGSSEILCVVFSTVTVLQVSYFCWYYN